MVSRMPRRAGRGNSSSPTRPKGFKVDHPPKSGNNSSARFRERNSGGWVPEWDAKTKASVLRIREILDKLSGSLEDKALILREAAGLAALSPQDEICLSEEIFEAPGPELKSRYEAKTIAACQEQDEVITFIVTQYLLNYEEQPYVPLKTIAEHFGTSIGTIRNLLNEPIRFGLILRNPSAKLGGYKPSDSAIGGLRLLRLKVRRRTSAGRC
jgi:hypothetical protein